MAIVAPPILPEYFYRYRSLGPEGQEETPRREIDAILKSYIWCSTFMQLNDPMEGYFALTDRLQRRSNVDSVSQAIMEGKTGVGIASMSDSFTNDLMWTHYASNWTGICIEYRAKTLIAALPEDATIVRMAYNEEPAKVGLGDSGNINDAVKKALSQKKQNWAYEREWRVLGKIGKNYMRRKKVVRRVFLGPRITDEHSMLVRSILRTTDISIRVIKVDGYRIFDGPFRPLTSF